MGGKRKRERGREGILSREVWFDLKNGEDVCFMKKWRVYWGAQNEYLNLSENKEGGDH